MQSRPIYMQRSTATRAAKRELKDGETPDIHKLLKQSGNVMWFGPRDHVIFDNIIKKNCHIHVSHIKDTKNHIWLLLGNMSKKLNKTNIKLKKPSHCAAIEMKHERCYIPVK